MLLYCTSAPGAVHVNRDPDLQSLSLVVAQVVVSSAQAERRAHFPSDGNPASRNPAIAQLRRGLPSLIPSFCYSTISYHPKYPSRCLLGTHLLFPICSQTFHFWATNSVVWWLHTSPMTNTKSPACLLTFQMKYVFFSLQEKLTGAYNWHHQSSLFAHFALAKR